MIFKKNKIKGVFLIKHDLVKDVRGVFKRSFCKRVLKKYNFDVKQGNISENIKKLTLRGFHYQKLPSKESKIITCISGKIYNIVLDLRKQSKTYKKWTKIILDDKNRDSLLIPYGCANAYLTLEKNTIIHYYMSDFYNPKSYKGIRYNDPNFKFIWPYKPKIISDRDNNFKDFNG
tara:strand:- start:3025 stop:3549 length:525 start_codon:yes stop_codon:yes gene_type:complete